MNDFTKEELQILGGCVFSKFVASLDDPSIQHLQSDLKNIRHKIESLIDSYCEHECNGYWHQLADCSYRFKRCAKCRREFDRQKWNNETEGWDNDNQ